MDNPCFVVWIIKWSVPLKTIFIGERLKANDELRTSLFQVVGKALRRIDSPIRCFDLTIAGVPSDVARYCTNLEQCSIESNEDNYDELILTILVRNAKLRVLALHCTDALMSNAF